eukprot:gene9407-17118_t
MEEGENRKVKKSKKTSKKKKADRSEKDGDDECKLDDEKVVDNLNDTVVEEFSKSLKRNKPSSEECDKNLEDVSLNDDKKKRKKTKKKSINDSKIVFSDEMNNLDENKDNLTEVLTDMDTAKLQKVKKIKPRKKKEVLSDVERSVTADKKDHVSGQDGTDESMKLKEVNPAIEYLVTWKKDKNNWSFKKVRQVWLLKSLYDESKVSNKHFKILLKYMKDLKGNSRQETLNKAREIMEKNEGK